MSKSTHTPGPWEFFQRRNSDELDHDDIMAGNRRVANVYGDKSADPGRANARLIAAAPDLLAACEAAIEYAETCGDFPENISGRVISLENFEALKSAVAKAKGTP